MAQQGNPADRRRSPRVEITVEVSVTSENNFYTGFTSDVSEGGVFIAGMNMLPIGAPMQFELKLGKGSVLVEGVVRWVREHSDFVEAPPGMGVEFINLPPAVAQKINEFMALRRESIFYDDDDE
ncbi:MAG: TIGR02266 family protein [Deltaproteobacteria bacterium]|nr:TIGR02266 family protein [Deltaproteobacteria bacterium]